mgnify:CR=1 FL=1
MLHTELTMSTLKPVRADGMETHARMKAVAQGLFALHGIDGVTVADIVSADGQRNKASLQYHFGSKDELIGELLVDGAQKVDAFRLALLDQLACGDFAAVRRQVDILGEAFEPDEFLAQLESEHRVKPQVRERRSIGFTL